MSDLRKSAFDAARRADDDGRFTQNDVNILNAALEAAGVPESRFAPDAPSHPEELGAPQDIGPKGIALIKEFEGCARKRPDGKIEAYPDPGTGGDPWTIGWGTTRIDGRAVRPGEVITQEEADALLEDDLVRYVGDVKQALGSALSATSQKQFDALVSFHYNTGAIARATLTRKHKAHNFAGAEREFLRWVNAGGRVMKGLVRRREAEAALYRSGS